MLDGALVTTCKFFIGACEMREKQILIVRLARRGRDKEGEVERNIEDGRCCYEVSDVVKRDPLLSYALCR